jgi:hypothetical protein
MSTGEGDNPRDGEPKPQEDKGRGDRIGVGGGDDSVSRIQLAARWAEAFAAPGDSLGGMLRRFRAAYEYLDAVIHGVEPPEMDSVAEGSHAAEPVGSRPGPPPPWSNPEPAPAPPPPPPSEPRTWG